MPWPIPTFVDIKHPKPCSLRTWLPTLFAIASGGAGVVLLLWPQGKPTQTFEFLSLLFGVPFVACCIVFGVALDRWEGQKIEAEEGVREQRRLMKLWRLWCCRDVRIAAAVAITPVPTSTFNDANSDLPVNKDRSKGLVWKSDDAVNKQFGEVVTQLASRLKNSLESRREVIIELLHADMQERLRVFSAELKAALEAVAPGVRFIVNNDSSTQCAQWIASRVDRMVDASVLIIAPQIWPEDESLRPFTEGVAALLLEPTASLKSPAADWNNSDDGASSSSRGRIFRPMASSARTLEIDMVQLMEIQAASDRPTHLWHAGCNEQLSSAIRSAMKADPKKLVIERSFDHVVGRPGPATNWIMLAMALEIAPPNSPPHLIAWRNPVDEQLQLCMIAPAKQTEIQKEN